MRPQPSVPAPPKISDRWSPPALPESVRIAVERSLGKTLTSNESRVMRQRYGIGVRACRLSEIAHRLGVRVTTVLRLHARALRKLRATAFPDSAAFPTSPPPASHQPSGCPPPGQHEVFSSDASSLLAGAGRPPEGVNGRFRHSSQGDKVVAMTTRTNLGTLVAMCCVLALGCGSHARLSLPPRVSGQIPAKYQLEEARGIVLARISVVTQGQPGFGAITNPLMLQFLPGDSPDGAARTVTLPDPDTYVFTGRSEVPSVWRYEPPGLLAMSIAPGTYDGAAIAYPDSSHQSATPSSIPAPSRAFVFAPVKIPTAAIVYLGDIEIRQRYGLSELMLDRVDVSYTVRDDYDRTVADFRARYPQLADVAVERRVLVSADPEHHR